MGEYVHMDDVVCVIETDKVSVDVRAEHSGRWWCVGGWWLVTLALVEFREVGVRW
jgi:hypothetical protein